MTNQELIAFLRKNPVGVVCAVLGIALAVVIYLRAGEVPAAEAELAQRTSEADRYAANIKNAAQLKEQYEALVAATEEIDSRLVRASQLGVNNQYFFKLESETGTKLVDFRQGGLLAAKGAKTNFSPVAFTVSIQGELPQLMHFLHLLESGTHYFRVQSATCLPAGAATRGLLTLTLNLELLGQP
jgi:hypothetical protein